jgi:hypothetical protein
VHNALLAEAPEAQVKKFYDRLAQPLLTHIDMDFGGLQVGEVSPSRVPDVFGGQPLVVLGRYKPGRGHLRVRGRVGGMPVEYAIPVDFPADEPDNATLGPLWARAKIADLSRRPGGAAAAEEEITELGLAYRLATPFTSFVAVEDKVVNEGGAPVTVQVPVEVPEGVSYKDSLGEDEEEGLSVGGASPTDAMHEVLVLRGEGSDRWGLRLGGGFGIAGRNEEGAFGIGGTLHLDVMRQISPYLLIGPSIALILGDSSVISLILQNAIYPFPDDLGLHFDVGAGGGVDLDGHGAVHFQTGLGYDVALAHRFATGIELRYDAALRPGLDERRTVHTVIFGIRIDWW